MIEKLVKRDVKEVCDRCKVFKIGIAVFTFPFADCLSSNTECRGELFLSNAVART